MKNHTYRICDSCGKNITEAYYPNHIRICNLDPNEKNLKCEHCPYKTHSRVQFLAHRNRYHNDQHNFNLEGVEIDERGILTCPACPKRMRVYQYVNHFKKEHNSFPPGYPTDKILKCDKCFAEVATLSSLKRHMSMVHGVQGYKKYKKNDTRKFKIKVCPYCGKSYNAKQLPRHMKNLHGHDPLEHDP